MQTLLQEQYEQALRDNAALLDALRAVNHTLSIHGRIDADTPLHDRIRALVA